MGGRRVVMPNRRMVMAAMTTVPIMGMAGMDTGDMVTERRLVRWVILRFAI